MHSIKDSAAILAPTISSFASIPMATGWYMNISFQLPDSLSLIYLIIVSGIIITLEVFGFSVSLHQESQP